MVHVSIPQNKTEWKTLITTGSEQGTSSQWINKDLAPTPKEARTWSW
jgi:NCS1 family nucleobase:cation symporter-1